MNLKIGDIIWAKRFKTKKEALSIKEKHRYGPFIVIKKTPHRTYALACTSNFYINTFQYKYNIGKINKSSMKETIICLDRVYNINKNNYMKKMGTLDEYRLNKINKWLYSLLEKEKISKVSKRDFKIHYTTGDLIEYKKELLYIYEELQEEYKCLKFKKGRSKNKYQVNGIDYTFNYTEYEKIKKNARIKLHSIATKQEKEKIEKRVKEMYKQRDSNVGMIIKTKDNYYYIYEEFNNLYATYKLYEEPLLQSSVIKAKKKYYTKFETKYLDKKEDYKRIIRLSNTEIRKQKEMEKNKEIKREKRRIKQRNTKRNKKIYPDFKAGTIVYDKRSKQKYLIIKRRDNNLVLYSLDGKKKIKQYTLTKNKIYRIYRQSTNIEAINAKIMLKVFEKN